MEQEGRVLKPHKRDPNQILWTNDRWLNYFCRLTLEVATMSTCTRRGVGCVLVKGKHVVSTGYNGVPAGVTHCAEKGCPRAGMTSGTALELCRGAHAEQNAIAHAARHGIALDGATAFVTTQPCNHCMKSLINAGVKTVYYMEGYPDELTWELANEAGIILNKLERGALGS